ncbi:polysaccharide deacetylase family protein [Butyrivibrio sp. DSM 10294]|nr:polysaccharide deacetylase family protein [Butyrivibrio sp. DSM 10294]MDC7294766.1 polysaccharide deacetylase family protein [Butyrivibrio sp. DSM 10294]
MTKAGQYTGNVNNPFGGVALYANNDRVSYTQYFASGTHDFTLRGCSNNDNMARVDLKIGGQTKGTFYYGGSYPAEYTIKNVSHGTGNQTIELVVTADNGQWDAYIDYFKIGGAGVGGNEVGNQGGSEGGNQGETTQPDPQPEPTPEPEPESEPEPAPQPESSETLVQCESMTKAGQYTGNVNSPFGGVALYANNDRVSYTQYFAGGTHDFTLRGCSNNSNMARVDLKIGGQTKGTFYYGGSYPAEYTIKNVSHGTGNQTIELVVTADDGQWDAYIDYLKITGAGVGDNTGNTGNNGGNNGGNNQGGNSANQKLIALTFDDGPSSTTSDVLDVLEKYNVKATFFLIGQNVNNNTLSIMQRQVRNGHELASHSYTHQDMTRMSAQQIRNEMEWTSSAIKNAVGAEVKFFRPPYISVNNTMYQNIDYPFIQGLLINDWENSTSVQQRVNNALGGAKDGQIILLHDFQGNSQTVQALPQIIEGLQNQGYTFVTVSELFRLKGVNANVEYKIWSNVNN